MPVNRNLLNNIKKNNSELSLLNSLKELKSPFRIGRLPELVKCCQFSSNQLKAVLLLFPKEDRYEAFKLLVKAFASKLSTLTDLEREELSVFLERDPAFNKLLPFAKKNLGGSFPVQKSGKEIACSTITQNIKSNKNLIKNNKKLTNNKVKNKKLTLEHLRSLLVQTNPISRFNFFKSLEIMKSYQGLMECISIDEFKNFIEVFPRNEAIKFLNLPSIMNQIKGFYGQNIQLSKESYTDLLNYFKPDQRVAVKKLLRPISPDIGTLQQGIFKEKNESKTKQLSRLPDIVASHKSL